PRANIGRQLHYSSPASRLVRLARKRITRSRVCVLVGREDQQQDHFCELLRGPHINSRVGGLLPRTQSTDNKYVYFAAPLRASTSVEPMVTLRSLPLGKVRWAM